jgi:two-component system alkaline phosphatase synthesis response regulator PhoP
VSRILIVEDDPDIALGLEDDLKAEGYEVVMAADGETGVRSGRSGNWDVILLDVMLPRRDGFDVCRDLRRAGVRTPIIMLTAKAQEAEKVLGLELGADDYVTKPFSLRELRARIHAQIRRNREIPVDVYRFDDVEVDFARAEIRRSGRRIESTATELKLLSVFIHRRGRVLSRELLLDQVWGRQVSVTDRAVDTHIVNLRKKIEPEPGEPRYLMSVRGLGYRFDG